ncbi:MAG: hypothetical protein OEV64_04085 [Desulfobulbaceae bacterium]|nr:hypothetical protein [Desulfobulbaceae bacterium]
MNYLFFVFAAYILGCKFVFNEDADVSGHFAASNAAYITAILTILFICSLLLKVKIIKPPRNNLLLVPLFYYGYGLLTSVFSFLPLVSLYRSATGIGFFLVSCSLGCFLNRFPPDKAVEHIYKLVWCIALCGILGAIIFDHLYTPGFSLLNLRAGYIGLITLYLCLWHLTSYYFRSGSKHLILAAFILIVTIYLHSFSAFIAFIGAIMVVTFLLKKYFISLIFMLCTTFMGVQGFSYLNENIDSVIMGKRAGAYLIGSGRFDAYLTGIAVYQKLDIVRQLIGVGFMAEREVLVGHGLTWVTDIHNSPLSSLMGLGVFGLIFYLLFTIAPFLYFNRFKKYLSLELTVKWMAMHSMFLLYGVTSSSYLATPSLQLILFSTFTIFMYRNYKLAVITTPSSIRSPCKSFTSF